MVLTNLKTLMHPEAVGRIARLDPAKREIIALAVSATNGCPYCINSHTAALRKLGMDEETLGEVMAIVGLFNMTNALANGYQVEPDVRPSLDLSSRSSAMSSGDYGLPHVRSPATAILEAASD